MASDIMKLSFAKVAAASASKDPTSITAIARAPVPAAARDRRDPNPHSSAAMPAPVPVAAPVVSLSAVPAVVGESPLVAPESAQLAESKVVAGLKELKLETKTSNLVINGSVSSATDRSGKTGTSQTPSDDNSQRADSSSELGTKPPSLDGKSIASGTTFALDEKESLRPDDSASVKAAADDDDTFSMRGSYIAGSRMGSDVAARIHRIQIGDMPPRTITSHALTGSSQSQGIVTPQSGVSDKQPAEEAKLPLVGANVAPDVMAAPNFLSQNPDEKLLEAMQSPKDRIFLLRLEQQVIDFAQASEEPFMDLPPSNSFCRMLTHKLADYYHMTHQFEATAGAVRIFKTPFCRIPPSLSSIAASTPSSSSPAPALLPRKIMRRGEDGEFGFMSAGASKATSEAGSDGKDKAGSREKLTREEREEAYNRARLRIFASIEKTESSTPEGEDANDISRTSSVSAKDRSNGATKRKPNKQRRDDSESFDSRSQYVAWCGPQQSTWAQAPAAPQYFPVSGSPYTAPYQQPYQNSLQTAYGPNQAYPQMAASGAFAPQYNGIPSYPSPPVAAQAAPPQQPRYPPPSNPPMPAPYSSPVPSLSQPAWSQQQPFNQNTFPGRGSPSTNGVPYLYGQLPVNVNPNDPKSQHPIPGSYNRQAFNPKTQSFVPGNGMGPIPSASGPGPVSAPYGSSSSHHGSPQFNSQHMSYTGYQLQPIPQPGYAPGPGPYSMTRQGSSSSMGPYHAAYQPSHLLPHGPHHFQQNPTSNLSNKSAGPPGPIGAGLGQTFSHLPNYGNPATLPQKPST
ncbi:hypothetical protein B0T26DRAFT_698693 [Lasiosphaeria miniovina]|uniref:R3H domain-containing protein n=1 Tax=Lasiosphaeria miniovina TaxID=1954250 RepID=A0AA40EAS0_9PEZI|nr:uncharacterized protein B0T26DRAFT_698693 [Lasiosphaeria miniovina]KAK0728613.1 hypothetical protein B0T26DRAFT_698693 [Lasiosphaeria miniovina]